MAVEANHFNIFSPQFSPNRNCVQFQQNENGVGGCGESFDLSALVNEDWYLSALDELTATPGTDFNFNSPNQNRVSNAIPTSQTLPKRDSNAFTLFNTPEIMSQIQLHQSEIDVFVIQQTEKLRFEIESLTKSKLRILEFAAQDVISRKIREKEDEINRIRNVNCVLQERLKNLYVENQLWKDLAQSHEVTANNLRRNLDYVLTQIKTLPNANANAGNADMESSCGSCSGDENSDDGYGETVKAICGGCKMCGSGEASVLVLPCRHLCLCPVCGSGSIVKCPVCDMDMAACVHVNMSS